MYSWSIKLFKVFDAFTWRPSRRTVQEATKWVHRSAFYIACICISLFTTWNKHIMHSFTDFIIDFFKLSFWILKLMSLWILNLFKRDSSHVVLLICVDDIVLTRLYSMEIDNVINALFLSFAFKDLDSSLFFLWDRSFRWLALITIQIHSWPFGSYQHARV